jgi:hypothetical protein
MLISIALIVLGNEIKGSSHSFSKIPMLRTVIGRVIFYPAIILAVICGIWWIGVAGPVAWGFLEQQQEQSVNKKENVLGQKVLANFNALVPLGDDFSTSTVQRETVTIIKRDTVVKVVVDTVVKSHRGW